VRNARSGEHVATLMCNPPVASSRQGRMTPSLFAARLVEVARRYNNALIVMGLDGPADGATLQAIRDVHHYDNVYAHDPGNYYDGYGPQDGMRTTPQTKEKMVADFTGALEAREFSTYDIRVSQQMADFIVWLRKSSGYEKVGARAGAHDDLMMAILLSEHGRVRAAREGGGMGRPAVVSQVSFSGRAGRDEDIFR
jgi:hypothetical protein